MIRRGRKHQASMLWEADQVRRAVEDVKDAALIEMNWESCPEVRRQALYEE